MDEIDAMIAQLVDDGALIVDGMYMDEFTYRFDMKILKEKHPDVYDLIMKDVDETLLELLNYGYVSVEYDEKLEAKFSLTEKGFMAAEEIKKRNGEYYG